MLKSIFGAMPLLTADDRAVISACFREKGWRGKKLCKEFPGKKWNIRTVNRLIKSIEQEGTSRRLKLFGIMLRVWMKFDVRLHSSGHAYVVLLQTMLDRSKPILVENYDVSQLFYV